MGCPGQRTAAMLRLPARFAAVILCFAPLFRQLTWRHAQVLLVGAILVPGQRTVTSILRISGFCWARRVWALPFLTALAPSERYSREHGRRHKKLTDWARQLVLQARRWMPERRLVLVADSSFAALELLASLVRQDVTCVTRLRLDAALYTPAPLRQPKTRGRPRTKGERLPTLATVLADQATPWQRLTVPDWYGEGERV